MRKFGLAVAIFLFLPGLLSAADFFVKHKDDHRQGEPTAETALVYVFRPAVVGAAVKTWAFADESLIGVTRAKGFSFANVEPGLRTVWAKAENTSGIEVDLQAGETYYFKTGVRMGLGKARVKLTQIDEAEAMKHLAKCSFCEPTEEGLARAAEIAVNRVDRAENNARKRKD